MKISNEELKRVIGLRNKENAFAVRIGYHVTDAAEGFAKGEMDVTPLVMNPIGSVHGGCLFTVADSTAGMAAASYGEKITTMDADFHFLRPCLHEKKILGVGQVVKHGRRVSVVETTVENEEGVVFAKGTFTFMGLGEPFFPELQAHE